MDKLKFSKDNSKMHELAHMLGVKKTHVTSFDIPAGFTCPAASLCQTYANKRTGKLTHGAHSKFNCYASKIESAFPSARRAHWYNFEAIRACKNDVTAMRDLILASIPKSAKIVRIHSSGDFFNTAYFHAWAEVAWARPDLVFFGYTKVLPLLQMPRPSNMHLVYSHGGNYDIEAAKLQVPTCYVVKDIAEAEAMGIPVACAYSTSPDDYNYIIADKSFAIVIH